MNPCARLLIVAAVAAALTLSACGGSKSEKSETTGTSTTDSSAVTSTTVDPADQAVVDAYRRFWDVYIAASNPMNPMDPRLGEVATGDELRQVSSSFLASRSLGEVFKGTIDLAPHVVERTDGRATIRDCYDSHIGVFDVATGAEKEPGGGKEQVVATLEQQNGTWKVASLKREAVGCIAS